MKTKTKIYNLNKILKIKSIFNISDNFYKKTTIKSFPKETKEEKIPESWIKINYKTYPRLEKLLLPNPGELQLNLKDAIINRRSNRDFISKSLNINKLSSLIYYSAGVTNKDKSDWNEAYRAYPSAGGRYPLELYVVINNVNSVDQGLYHYNVKENSLELLLKEDLSIKISNLTGQDFVKKANVVFLLSGVLDRTRIKYQDRGLRYVFMECGHLSQNLYLISEALNLSCCAIGGFVDGKLDKLLDIQSSSEKILYLVAIGNKKHEHSK